MQIIKRLKSLGLDLKHIKEILGDTHNHKTLREVLESLHIDLLSEKKRLEERIAKIELLLSEDKVLQDEDICDSPSFQMITEILEQEQIDNYARTCELSTTTKIVWHWLFQGRGFQKTFSGLAEHFKLPEQYQISLVMGASSTYPI